MFRIAVCPVVAERGSTGWIIRWPVNTMSRRVSVVVGWTRPGRTRGRRLVSHPQPLNSNPAEMGDRPALTAFAGSLEQQREGDRVVAATFAPEPLPVPVVSEDARGTRSIRDAANPGDVLETMAEILLRLRSRAQPSIRLPRHVARRHRGSRVIVRGRRCGGEAASSRSHARN